MSQDLEVTIKANIKQLKKDLSEAENELKKLKDPADDIEGAFDGVLDSVDKLGSKSGIFNSIDAATGGIAGNALDIIKGFKGAAVSANLFKTALIGTGIGAIVVAVGVIAVYWDDIVDAVYGVSRELKRQIELQQESVDLAQTEYDIINAQINSLKLSGKTDKEINKIKISRLQILLQEKKALLDLAQTQLDNTIKSERESRRILLKFVGLAFYAQQELAKTFDNIFGTNFEGDVKAAQKSFIDFIAGTDSKEGQKEVNDLNIEVLKLQDSIDKLKLDNIKIDKKAADDLRKLFESIDKDLEILDEQQAGENAIAVAEIYEESGARIKDALKIEADPFDFGLDDSIESIKSFESKLQDIRKLLNDENFNFAESISLDQMDKLVDSLEFAAQKAVAAKELTNAAISGLSSSLANSIQSDNEIINAFTGAIIATGEKLLTELASQALAGIAVKQATATAQIATDQAVATSGAIASASSTAAASGPGAAFLLPALIGAAVGFIAASFSGLKFATGGIVPGGSYNGDQVPALLNSSEMVLNRGQQAELFKLANGASRQASAESSTASIVVGKVIGQDILLVSKRAERSNKKY
ncbi:putative tail length tape measure protein [Cellulophaga phage phi12:1]|uniref:Putative tail length tape measure protein n=2 Tax=Cellulophaga phage phi12:1 TaxID=1327976 RepID=S0A1E3_9CAUD|nr:tail length tape measure protein [Cellulophaga phage phi12:1]AGO48023.1 putative tail length tape measure protein [Cellulophaga phage phi12:1]AGO48188.1 putative tail length tape measure protein [Cellulophaga phage phi12:3]